MVSFLKGWFYGRVNCHVFTRNCFLKTKIDLFSSIELVETNFHTYKYTMKFYNLTWFIIQYAISTWNYRKEYSMIANDAFILGLEIIWTKPTKQSKGSTENNNNVISTKTQNKQVQKETCLNRLMSSKRKIRSFSRTLYNETK